MYAKLENLDKLDNLDPATCACPSSRLPQRPQIADDHLDSALANEMATTPIGIPSGSASGPSRAMSNATGSMISVTLIKNTTTAADREGGSEHLSLGVNAVESERSTVTRDAFQRNLPGAMAVELPVLGPRMGNVG